MGEANGLGGSFDRPFSNDTFSNDTFSNDISENEAGDATFENGAFGNEALTELFNRIREQQQREAKGLVGLEGFERIEGELPIETTLELAVLTLVHHRYCGMPQWRLQKTYSFTLEGVFQRTWVEAWDANLAIQLTPEAAIGIARQLNQQDFEEW